jgi:hypothetical protein
MKRAQVVANVRPRLPLFNRARLSITAAVFVFTVGMYLLVLKGLAPPYVALMYLLGGILFCVHDLLVVVVPTYYQLSNRADLLYIRKYGSEVPKPDSRLYHAKELSNVRTLQFLCYLVLRFDFDIIGLLPPKKHAMDHVMAAMDYRSPMKTYFLETVDTDDWKQALRGLLDVCRGCIIECNEMSDSLNWEIQQVTERYPPEKIILVAEAKRKHEATAVRAVVTRASGRHCGKSQANHMKILYRTREWDREFADVLRKRARKIVSIAGHEAENRKRRKRFRVCLYWLTLMVLPISILCVFVASITWLFAAA